MPGCVAVDCSNSSAKGFLMKRFPMDPERRRQWQINTRRVKWTPTNNSYLCEVHFTADMWEKTREDGTRKLKMNAMPTIFTFSINKTSRKPPIQREVTIPEEIKPFEENLQVQTLEALNVPHIAAETSTDPQCPSVASTSNSSTLDRKQKEMTFPEEIKPFEENLQETVLNVPHIATETSTEPQYTTVASTSNSSTLDSSSDRQSLPSTSEGAIDVSTLDKYKKLYYKQRLKSNKYKRLLRNCRLQLKNAVAREKMLSQLDESSKHFVFNEDQMEALRRRRFKKSTKFMKWSNETITKSLKLKLSCGNKGYKELLKQGYPLPSIKTLQRKLQQTKFDSST